MEEPARKDRTLRAEGTVNARDLGGLERVDGTLTPSGVFFRSDNVDRISPDGWQHLHEAGIRTVVDLRQPEERERDTQKRPAWLTTINVDLDGLENTDFWAGYWDNGLVGTAMYFLPHLTEMPERAGAAVSAIVNAPPGGVLFHCMGGRDRTGIIAMILLSAVSADTEEIVDDYLETVRLGDTRAASDNRNNAESLLNELCERHGTTTEGAFRTALAGFDLPGFIKAAGLHESDRAALFSWRGSVVETAGAGSL
ncbi:tyrosine-protein phosphatase [Arthrobacter sp. StoSoilB20]|uniref:tyrosine-protein phosphatase n=1 Tax=Arthrobacter sp. StoSoilB20 TaxID=2830995 RepID=UPI001CC6EA92|nr:tyrosine-protein phosphatase [Arthrobacter sp. StoSoilB20]BCW57874.1 protein-tyrosine-phosphatase [Arthrobacter sp. StoSoilB20]